MVWSPQLQRVAREGGSDRYQLGHELVDAFLEFAAGRARPNTVRAYAHDLKVFFTVVDQRPRRGDAGRRDGLRRRTAAATAGCRERRPLPRRRIGAVTGDRHAPPGGGLCLLWLPVDSGRHAGGGEPGATGPAHPAQPPGASGAPLVRGSATSASDPRPRGSCGPPCRRCGTRRDRAITEAMLLGGLRRCEALGLRLEDIRLGECRVFIVEGKGGHQRLVPMSPTFFATVADYLECERPIDAPMRPALRRVERTQPWDAAVHRRPRRGHGGGQEAGRAHPRHLPRAPPHLPDQTAGGGDVPRGPPGPGRTPIDRLDPGLSAPRVGLVGRRVPGRQPTPSRPTWRWRPCHERRIDHQAAGSHSSSSSESVSPRDIGVTWRWEEIARPGRT